jgi:hypothetical protein
MSEKKPAIASFKTLPPATEVTVHAHFNPASLQYSVSNTLAPATQGAGSRQFVSQTVAKLTMDLVFDTTAQNHSSDLENGVKGGEDVRTYTDKMAKLLQPFDGEGGKTPPRVEFSWGLYKFTGTVEQYKETLDLFSADGVPLRAAVNLTLSSDTVNFDSAHNPQAKVDTTPGFAPVQVPGGDGPAGVAKAGGDARAARAIAGANASASLRFGGSASLLVEAKVSLGAPAAFAIGGGAGLGFGVGGGAGVGAGLSLGGGVGATAGVAFGGLRAGVSSGTSLPNPQSLLPAAPATAGAGLSFAPGGMAQGGGAGSLGTDVGAQADLQARMNFET